MAHGVEAGAAAQHIGTGTAGQGVVAGAAAQVVGAGRTHETVVATGGVYEGQPAGRHQTRQVEHLGRVGAHQALAIAQPVLQLAGRGVEAGQHQRGRAGDLQPVARVLAAFAQDEHVAQRLVAAGLQQVVARAAVHGVAADATVQRVVAGIAHQPVVARAALQRIGARPARQAVGTAPALHHRQAGQAAQGRQVQQVGAVGALQGLAIAQPALDAGGASIELA